MFQAAIKKALEQSCVNGSDGAVVTMTRSECDPSIKEDEPDNGSDDNYIDNSAHYSPGII